MRSWNRTITSTFIALLLSATGCGNEEVEHDCNALCAAQECGKVDNCVCGTCGEEEECKAGLCCDKSPADACAAVCSEGICGDVDGCTCGGCGVGEVCGADSLCDTDPCAATCQGMQCGVVEGCDCGACPGDETCSPDGQCLPHDPCLDLCVGLECGGDDQGCNCGSCESGKACVDGLCACKPDCIGSKKVCGSDGCGGTCGDCEAGSACGSDGKCYPTDCLDEIVFQEAQKIHFMEIGKGGHAGEALDVDGDPDTCAPEDDCEDGLDNQLSGLLGQIVQFVDPDEAMAGALEDGSIVLLVELVDFADDGSPFLLNMYLGDPVADKDTCDYQADTCEYLVDPNSFDPAACEPLIAFDNATVTDGKLTAGGPDNLFNLSIPVQDGLVLDVTANMAQIQGDIVGDGAQRTIANGLVGGAIRKDKLIESVQAVPDELFEDLPVSKSMVINIIEMFITPDIDTDDDGDPDAASVGLKFATIPAVLTGVAEGE